ncbi:TPA_asm: M [Pogostemom alphacytorhabdovirus 2]|nr:TPA_asm: M [Pogostemom alphacytorhabdovirus 2]
MLKIKKALPSAKKDSEPSSGSEPISEEWVCVIVQIKTFEVEIGDKRSFRSFPSNNIEHSLISLIETNVGGESGKWVASALTFFLDSKRWGKCVDCRTSPYLGPKTKRVSYLLDKMNVIFRPQSPVLGKVPVAAVGKKSVIDGTPVRATVRMDIITKMWSQEMVDRNVEIHPEWFCGSME